MPRPGPGEVLIEVDHCGICGSDIHMLLDGWAGKPGLVAGHEFTGTVAALGEGVDGWEIGETVVGGTVPRVRAVPPLPGGQALPVRDARARSPTATTGPSPAIV